MRTVAAVYEKYRIPSWLQLHQLRVAAIGKLVAQHGGVDADSILRTGLFHDMGNILKFDFSPGGSLVKLLESEGLDYWRAVRKDFEREYGFDEHNASLVIGKEIGLSDTVLTMIDNMRFTRTQWILDTGSIEMKIIKYADLRVGPFGIVSLTERLAEGRARYRGKAFDAGEKYTSDELAATETACAEIEEYLVRVINLVPSSITDEQVAPLIDELREYEF